MIELKDSTVEWFGDARNVLSSTSEIISGGSFSVDNFASFQHFASGTCRYFFELLACLDFARAGFQGRETVKLDTAPCHV